MHIPDGFFDGPTSVAAGAAAVGVLAVAAKRSGADDDEMAPLMMGLTATYVFAVQMLNFPVASGTSGHLLGGALAAVLVGPWRASICLAVVLAVQALFADGGLTALGLNVLLIGIIPAFCGHAVFGVARRLVPTRAGVVVGAGVAAFVSVPVAAAAFSVLYAVGGTADLAFGSLATAMIGTHVLIGVGEGVITALTVAAVVASRPDLVRAIRDVRPPIRGVEPVPASA